MVAPIICSSLSYDYVDYYVGKSFLVEYPGVDFSDFRGDGYYIRTTYSIPPEISLDEILSCLTVDKIADYDGSDWNTVLPFSDVYSRSRISNKIFGDEVFLKITGKIDFYSLRLVFKFTDYYSLINEWEVSDELKDSYKIDIPSFSGYVKLSDVYSFVISYLNPFFDKMVDFVRSNYKFEPYNYSTKHIPWGKSSVIKFPPSTIQDRLRLTFGFSIDLSFPVSKLCS
ncbi:hypothetical protein [Campylobacter hyointestinalis]|uniref:Uncharacterized protein n=1 Tax=Campylobacter hyointestinalis subsp. lawsonii TaxID=91353 RepID=A0AAV6EBW2_CAMHY|nr:hypothetical protein [Campylobacter hyointestinalis]KAB0610915.1 hypothetical protein F7P66_08975 [Campylobacter hyointestinalis subsp. lawsonii]QKF69744.1 hypothetical protein CHLWT_1185 [Campylobacter hyointestinalis subsp. lawsonii]RAZ27097.1 hypothetical protein CHLT_09220 [Campylobacter hyointestinalis subsp. lawsonii]